MRNTLTCNKEFTSKVFSTVADAVRGFGFDVVEVYVFGGGLSVYLRCGGRDPVPLLRELVRRLYEAFGGKVDVSLWGHEGRGGTIRIFGVPGFTVFEVDVWCVSEEGGEEFEESGGV